MATNDMGPEERGSGDAVNFRRSGGALGEQPQQVYHGSIGGTYRHSTKLGEEQALTGGYQQIEGDTMPPCPGTPYLPGN